MSNVVNIQNVQPQEIEVSNTQPQEISISQKQPQKLEITNHQQQVGFSNKGPQRIGVTNTLVVRIGDGVASVNGKIGDVMLDHRDVGAVPIELSILPQATDEQLNTVEKRQEGKVYIEINHTPSMVSIEQIKQLGTKTITVDTVNDNAVESLSAGDYIYLRKEKK